MQFLLRRRMHLARRALREADPAATTVTAIAMQCGFWELGHCAAEYRTLFKSRRLSPFAGRPKDARNRLSNFRKFWSKVHSVLSIIWIRCDI
jgi:transcriptional regulator GlxA family with amidase domain